MGTAPFDGNISWSSLFGSDPSLGSSRSSGLLVPSVSLNLFGSADSMGSLARIFSSNSIGASPSCLQGSKNFVWGSLNSELESSSTSTDIRSKEDGSFSAASKLDKFEIQKTLLAACGIDPSSIARPKGKDAHSGPKFADRSRDFPQRKLKATRYEYHLQTAVEAAHGPIKYSNASNRVTMTATMLSSEDLGRLIHFEIPENLRQEQVLHGATKEMPSEQALGKGISGIPSEKLHSMVMNHPMHLP